LQQFISHEETALEIAQEAIERKMRTLEDTVDRIGKDACGVAAGTLLSNHVLTDNINFGG
jgi:hypothetical protein